MHSNQQQPLLRALTAQTCLPMRHKICAELRDPTTLLYELVNSHFFNACFWSYLDCSVILPTLRPTKHMINRKKKYDHVEYRGTSTHFPSGCTPGSNLAADACWLTLESKHHTQGSFTEKRHQSGLINWRTAPPCGEPRLLQFLTVTEAETGQQLVASFIQLDICPCSLP